MPDARLERTRRAYREDFWRIWREWVMESPYPPRPIIAGDRYRHWSGREWVIGPDLKPREVYDKT